MNSNTILGFSSGTGRNKFAPQTIAASGITALTVGTDTGTAVAQLSLPLASAVVGSSNPLSINANPAILSPALGAALQGAGTNRPYFNSDSFSGRQVKVRITGDATNVTAAQIVSINLYCQAGTTPVTGNLIASTASAATIAAAGTFSFALEATVMWDGATLTVTGTQTSVQTVVATPVLTGPALLTNALTAVPLASVSFIAAAALTNATSVTIQVREFTLELV